MSDSKLSEDYYISRMVAVAVIVVFLVAVVGCDVYWFNDNNHKRKMAESGWCEVQGYATTNTRWEKCK